jgi:hypothetical protein
MSKAIRVVPFVILCALVIAVPSVWANWVQDGVALCTVAGEQIYPAITSDGAGGAIVTWRDGRSGSWDIYAQGVNASGAVRWTADGVALCTAAGERGNPKITSDGAGGVIVTWHDRRSGNYDIYAQRVNASGAVQWTADGVALCTAAGDQGYYAITSDGAGGAIVTWEDSLGGSPDIYAQRVNASGAVQWTADGVALCMAPGSQWSPEIISDGAGGAIVSWRDRRSGSWDIYTQWVNASGAVQWTADGVALCTAAGDQGKPEITSDGAGGAIVTWTDRRSGNYDIYAQRVNASGAVQWTADGVALGTAAGNQGYYAITSDGAGGAIATWEDNLSGSPDIYAQRVNASGTVQWTADGVALCMAPEFQWNPEILSDGAGGAIVAWQDRRSGIWDIYTQWVNAWGAVQWTADGVALCTAAGDQTFPTITSDGAGGAFVAWYDGRSGNSDIYAQRIDATGNQPIATLLQRYSSSASDQGITVTWTLAEIDSDMEFFILRAPQDARDFKELSTVGLAREGLAFEFVDRDAEPGTTYTYRVDIQMGSERRTLFETGPVEVPAVPMTLYQNHPNPFNPSTAISYYVPTASQITLDIYDSSGKLVVRLIDSEERPKGANAVEWSGVDAQGRPVSSGVYYYRLTTGKQTYSKKMVLLR